MTKTKHKTTSPSTACTACREWQRDMAGTLTALKRERATNRKLLAALQVILPHAEYEIGFINLRNSGSVADEAEAKAANAAIAAAKAAIAEATDDSIGRVA